MCSCHKVASFFLDLSRSPKWVWDPWQTDESVCVCVCVWVRDGLPVERWFCRSEVWSSLSVWVHFLSDHWSQSRCRTSACPGAEHSNNEYTSSVSPRLIVSVPCAHSCLGLGLLAWLLSCYCKASLRLQTGAIVIKPTIIIRSLNHNWKILNLNTNVSRSGWKGSTILGGKLLILVFFLRLPFKNYTNPACLQGCTIWPSDYLQRLSAVPGRRGDPLSPCRWGETAGSWPPDERHPTRCWTSAASGGEPGKDGQGYKCV